jgi:hypothetical protein
LEIVQGGARYTGQFNSEEELEGNGILELGQVRYEGEFKESKFHGHGRLTYPDTGNVYEGGFFQHHKDGPCTFTLKETGQVYRGAFDSNYETTDKVDYGPRV